MTQDDPWRTRDTLINRIRDPEDQHAWSDFTHYYQQFMVNILRYFKIKEDQIDDLVQVILLKVWKAIPDYTENKNNAKFRTWFRTIIKNTCLNHFRQESLRKKSQISIDSIELQFSKDDEITKIIEREWELNVTKKAIANVSPKFSDNALKAFKMSLDGDSIEQISRELNIKENSAYKLKNRFKQHVIEEIKQIKTNYEIF